MDGYGYESEQNYYRRWKQAVQRALALILATLPHTDSEKTPMVRRQHP